MMGLKEGAFTETTRQDLADVFSEFKNGPHSTMVIHFHGGLVSREAGIANAVDLNGRYSSLASCLFPIWETGLAEVLKRDWPAIARDTLFQVLRDRVMSAVFAKAKEIIGLRGLTIDYQPGAFMPFDLAQSAQGPGDVALTHANMDLAKLEALTLIQEKQLEAEFVKDTRLNAEFQAVINAHVEGAPSATRAAFTDVNIAPRKSVIDQSALDELVADSREARAIPLGVALRVLSLIKDVILRFLRKTDHGLHATATEEILRALYLSAAGTSVWGQMKRYANAAFQAGPAYGGTALLDEIATLPAGKSVLLIGHSAGAIFISELLIAAHARGMTTPFDVIFLAPAVRDDLFADALTQAVAFIRNFRMYTMTDENECRDVLVRTDAEGHGLAWFYPRSLLYFIAGILEQEVDSPLVGMQRFYDAAVWDANDASVAAIRGFVTAQGDRACWSVHSDPGDVRLNANALAHGDFGHSEMHGGVRNATVDGICEILKTGRFRA
jgi:hypothetical protein